MGMRSERSCELFHLTASSMIFNRERTKVLMAYHNIFQSWAWTGGHADGEPDGLVTALKEAREETGIQTIRPLQKELAAVDILEVRRHIKRGQICQRSSAFQSDISVRSGRDGSPAGVRRGEQSGGLAAHRAVKAAGE